VVWLGGWRSPLTTFDWIDRANALLLPLAIFVGLAAIRRRRGPLGDLVVELGGAGPGEIGNALARALGDPSLELALWLPERRVFVDEAGEPIVLALAGNHYMVKPPPASPESLLDRMHPVEDIHRDSLLAWPTLADEVPTERKFRPKAREQAHSPVRWKCTRDNGIRRISTPLAAIPIVPR